MSCCCLYPIGLLYQENRITIDELVDWAGGNANAELRFSMWWDSWSDVDFHLTEPNGNHIMYNNRSGKLDVDMNVGSTPQAINSPTKSKPAVENISFAEYSRDALDGTYKMYFVQYGVWAGRADGADAPTFKVRRRYYPNPDNRGVTQDDHILLKYTLGNQPQNTQNRIHIATFNKQSDVFTITELGQGVILTELVGSKIALGAGIHIGS